MIDISDGLSSEVLHLLNQVGFHLLKKNSIDPVVSLSCEEFKLNLNSISKWR